MGLVEPAMHEEDEMPSLVAAVMRRPLRTYAHSLPGQAIAHLSMMHWAECLLTQGSGLQIMVQNPAAILHPCNKVEEPRESWACLIRLSSRLPKNVERPQKETKNDLNLPIVTVGRTTPE